MTPQEQRAAEQIRAGQTSAFRSSYAWQQTAAKARLSQHNECQDCRARGLYTPAEEVHHVEPVEVAPHRALDMSNLCCLCRSCHRLRHGWDVAPLTPEQW